MTAHVYSTLTSDHVFVVRGTPPAQGQPAPILKRVLINGGTGVANKRTLITPYGVHTEVSDDDLAVLEQDPSFQRFKQRGFIRVEKRESRPEIVAQDMAKDTGSAPLTPADYADNIENDEGATPVGKRRGRKPRE